MPKVNYDFTQESLRIPLSVPVHYPGLTSDKGAVIKSVRLSRLYAPDLTRLKLALTRRTESEEHSFLLMAREIINIATEAYYNADGTEFEAAGTHVITGMLTLTDAYKFAIYTMMLTRESSFITTSYKCTNCGKTLLFDLDPENPVPKDVEPERAYMQNVLELLHDKINRRATPGIEFKPKTPYKIDNTDGEEESDSSEESGESESPAKPRPKTVSIRSLYFTWPTLGQFLKFMVDSRKKDNSEMWVLYDSISRINTLTEEETTALKNHNGFDKIMHFKIPDLQELMKQLGAYGMEITNEFDCHLCGHHNTEQPFDYSNFFAYLKS